MTPFVLYSFVVAVLGYFLISLRSVFSGRRLPPGPKPWPIVGNLPHLGPMPHHSIASLARKHGPLMHLRLGFVDVVVAASASVAAQFLKTHDANFSSRPPNSGAKHLAYNYQDLVFAPYGPRWRMLRKISSVHLFSGKALDDFRHIREAEVGVLIRTLANAGQSAVNLGNLLNICTTNALGRVMVGRRVFSDGSTVADPKAEEFKNMVVEMMQLAGVFNIGDFVPLLEPLDLQGVAAKMKKLHKRFDAFFTHMLEDHKVVGKEQHTDLLSTLISLKDNADGEGGKLTDTEIKALLLAWQCSAEKEVAWNFLSLFTGTAILCLEISIMAFLLQDSYTTGLETLARTFIASGIVAGVDMLFKAIYVFGFRVPLFIDGIDGTQRMKWGLWIIHKLLLAAFYGYILFIHFSKWREKLPPRPAFHNYIVVMFVMNTMAWLACAATGMGAGFGIWLYNFTDVCYHSFYLPFLYVTFLADFFQEEDFLLDNAYYAEMRDAGFFDADWD